MGMFLAHSAPADSLVSFHYNSQAVGQLRVRLLLDCNYFHDGLKYALGTLLRELVALGQKTVLADEGPA